jgi:hypothetical protein
LFGFQFRMTVIGEAFACPTSDCSTNDRPSGETAYCCLNVFTPGLKMLVAKSAVGVPKSTVGGAVSFAPEEACPPSRCACAYMDTISNTASVIVA